MSGKARETGIIKEADSSGRVRYRVRVSYRSGGRLNELWDVSDTLKGARQKRVELKKKVAELKRRRIAPDRPKSVHELIAAFERERLVEAEYDENGHKVGGLRDAASYRRMTASFRRFFPASLHLDDLTPAKVEGFAAWLKRQPVEHYAFSPKEGKAKKTGRREKPRSGATVRRYLSLMRTMLTWAVRNGWIASNPFDRIELGAAFSTKVEATPGAKRVLSRDEEKRLLAACTGPRGHLRPILIAAIDTGRRIGELLNLRWSDVDLAKRTVTFSRWHSKTRTEQTLRIGKRLSTVLEGLYPARDGEHVFTGPTGEPLTTIKTAFTTACKEAEIVGLRIHDLRHTCASRLLEAGLTPAEIAAQLGHAQIETALRFYVHATDRAADRVLAAVDEWGTGDMVN